LEDTNIHLILHSYIIIEYYKKDSGKIRFKNHTDVYMRSGLFTLEDRGFCILINRNDRLKKKTKLFQMDYTY